MKKYSLPLFIFICGLIILPRSKALSQITPPSRTDWFTDARYGMFIHWGLYSAAEGLWKGEKLRYLNNYAEWIQYRNRISKDDYGELAKRFVWEDIDVEEWVILAKKSGMKYIIMTAKHHDGVALWDTQVGEYSLPSLSGTNRDVIKEIAEACRKHDMKLGFYYSHWIDWEHPYAWDHNQELTGHVTDEQFNQYWQEKAIPQLQELLTNYGDIAIMWFDMWLPYENTIFKKEQLEQAVALIRELQPNCLINSRLGLPTDAQYVDFQTLGDNVFGTDYTDHPWETPGTIAHSWGYSGQEKEWKSSAQLFESLISNVALNGGFTLNIGPRANGSIPYESISRLSDLGEWLSLYGESIYGSTGLGLRTSQHDWGNISTSRAENGDHIVYLQVYNWPLDNTLRVSGIRSEPHSIEVLGGIESLPFQQEGPLLHITVPKEQPNPFVSVLKLRYLQLELDNDVVSESTFGGFALHSNNAIQPDAINKENYDGLHPTHAVLHGPSDIKWKVYFPKPGVYDLGISFHNPGHQDVEVHVIGGSTHLTKTLNPSNQVVAEPNEDNYAKEFVWDAVGKLTVTQAGYQEITLKAALPIDGKVLFNRLWIDTK